MRPLSLQLSGFTCFKEPQVISFEDLELFAIQGPTGAGKSSILDAITYALYGQTARLGAKGLESLVSQGAGSMYVTLEFESNGRRYRVSRVWSVKQSEKQVRFDRQDGERWVTAVEGTKVKEVGEAIRNTIGLDYDGFTKAILLPQGEFDRFLRGDARERRELLKGLLSLQHYEDMRRLAYARAQDLKSQVDQRNFLLNGEYAEATAGSADHLKERISELERVGEALRVRVAGDRERLTELREVARLGNDLSGIRAKLASLHALAEAVEAERERAAVARRAATVLPRLEACEAAEKALERATREMDDRRDEYAQAVDATDAAEARYRSAVEASQQVTGLDTQLHELAAVRPKADRLKALGGKISDDHDDPLTFSEEAFARLQELATTLPALERAASDLSDLEADLAELERSRAAATARQEDARSKQQKSKEQGVALREHREQVEHDVKHARREEGIAPLLADLKLGDPCPVCQKPLGKLPEVGPSRVADIEKMLASADERLIELRGEYAAQGANLKAASEELERIAREVERTNKRRESTASELSRLRKAFAATLGDASNPRQALDDQRKRLVAGLAGEIRAATGGRDPDAVTRDLTARKKALQAEETTAREAAEKLRARSVALKAAAEAAAKATSERRNDTEARLAELETALAQSGLASRDSVRASAMSEAEVTRIEARVREHGEALTSAHAREAELLTALAGREPDPAGLRAAEDDLASAERDQKSAEVELATSRQRLSDLEARIAKAKVLRKEAAELGKKYDLYAQLANDLKGNEFQEFMLGEMQRELLDRASTLMREVTRDRYTLKLIEGEYHVLDNWNALEARSVKTLSGGESFIASLSLALALSDSLAGSKALGALFLDEGFGTLDAEALDSVASVLETIQTQGRMVGVITHVTSLAERLPTRLVVEKGPVTSSVHWDA